jgi:hypothetical protein
MKTLENDSAIIPFPTGESEPSIASGSYDTVRFNALKHGILSRHVVLPHEDANEYRELLAALMEEHAPNGATEMHLVEELAGIIWRKRRVLMAESAKINRGLHNVATSSIDSPVPAAVPFERGLSGKGTDVCELITMTPEDIAEQQRETKHDLDATEKAAAILRKGGPNAYEKALKALLPDSRDWWVANVEDEEYEPDAEGLSAFIQEHLLPFCLRLEKEARHHEAIKAQTLGEGLQAHRLERLGRYETHLDRKFERTLAMLLKLKELRNGGK